MKGSDKIDFDVLGAQITDFFNKILAWLTNFFNTIDDYEMIAVGVIGLGFIMFIVGLFLI